MKAKLGLAIYVLMGLLGVTVIFMDSIEATPDISDVLAGSALYLIGRDIWKNTKPN